MGAYWRRWAIEYLGTQLALRARLPELCDQTLISATPSNCRQPFETQFAEASIVAKYCSHNSALLLAGLFCPMCLWRYSESPFSVITSHYVRGGRSYSPGEAETTASSHLSISGSGLAPVELTPHGPGLFFRDPHSSGPLFLFSVGRDRGGSDDTPAPPQGAMSRRGLLALAS